MHTEADLPPDPSIATGAVPCPLAGERGHLVVAASGANIQSHGLLGRMKR